MLSKSLRSILSVGMIAGILLSGACSANSQGYTSIDKASAGFNEPAALTTGILYEQPVDPSGQILLSAWLDPDGSDFDEYVWDSFILPSGGTITEIDWYGLYDPLKFGKGGPVVDFTVSIYPSIAAGTEPAVAFPPLGKYQTGGNAGETVIGTVNGAPLYAYAFTLPASFTATAGVKYWVQIEASQQGSVPDWCFAAGWGGNASHYWRGRGAGGDIMYRTLPGDAAFALLGPVPDTATPTDTPTNTATATQTAMETLTVTPTDTATATLTPTDTPTSTLTDTATATNTLTITPTNTPTHTATVTYTLTDTPTSTSTQTATVTLTPTDTPTSTSTHTATATYTATETPTHTSTPLSNSPGKVTGGGTIGSEKDALKATFGFTIQYKQGDSIPKGNLVYQDHTSDMRLKATSFDLLVIHDDQAWFTGTGMLSDGQAVAFTVIVSESGRAWNFSISIPTADGYAVVGPLTGGNIAIH